MNRICNGLRERLQWFWDTKIHFLELHYIYIAFIIFVSSILYYCEPGTKWSYIDVLFTATTGCTNTGLNVIAMSDMSNYKMIILSLDSFIGSHIFLSIIIVMIRKYYFSKRFEDILLYNKAQQLREEHRRKEAAKALELEESLSTHTRLRKKSFLSTHSTPASGSCLTHTLPRSHSYSSPSEDNSASTLYNSFVYSHHSTEYQNTHQEKDSSSSSSSSSNNNNNNNSTTTTTTNTNDHHLHSPVKTNGSPYLQQNKIDIPLNQPSLCPTKDDICHREMDAMEMKERAAPIPSLASSSISFTVYPPPTLDLRRSTLYPFTHDMEASAGPTAAVGTQGIAFADNITRQREVARRRLEKTRRNGHSLSDTPDTSITYNNSIDESQETDRYEDIMRQPIDKSQLTREHRYCIGGVEYRALDMLSKLVSIYYIGSIVLFGFLFRIDVAASSYSRHVLETSNANGPVNAWLFSFFLSISSFNNVGLSYLDASMVPFQNSPAPLILSIILVLIGNTAYAIVLRFIIWCLYKLTPESRTIRKETFRYLLDHPRRCYTTLFPSTQTWWLLFILIAITLVEVVAFLSLNYWLPVLDGISWGSRVLDGVFQSVATRNAGFSVLSLADINPGTQLVYIVAMYISVYPVAISMRNSNVYQERSLGIFRSDDEEKIEFSEQELNGSVPFIKLRRYPTISSVITTSRRLLRGPDFFVITQIQRQLTTDICWVICGVFIICIIESQAIMSPSPITMATVIYECVSAFGNVGASTGYPNSTLSQAGHYRTLSKVVLIILMYRGRHRGLPDSIDRAVLLPSEQLEQKDMNERTIRRRNTMTSQTSCSSVLFYHRSSTL